ncbi:hypothetical protein BDR07DRAFT_1435938 [Suillus spraguei]|nr:hypothetical protein BDR07DRAFT_1435938 [Suillus spraguei]
MLTPIYQISSLKYHFGSSAIGCMVLVSNDPSWWPSINASLIGSYFTVAASIGVIYDWGLTLGQEVELIWKQRWSLMTFLYLSVRYLGIGTAILFLSCDGRHTVAVPTISMTDAVSLIINNATDWMSEAADVILGVIMIIRLYAMYQRSRKLLIFLIAIFLTVRIANTVMVAMVTVQFSGEEWILSGTYQLFLGSTTWILASIWEVLALCLVAWIAVKHFRELRQHSTRSIIGDCFTVLMKTHLSYFASFIAVSCFELSFLSPTLSANPYLLEYQIYTGFTQIFIFVQMFVLGPRLVLSVREYNAKLVTDSDAATAMTSIAFQEHVHVATSSSV